MEKGNQEMVKLEYIFESGPLGEENRNRAHGLRISFPPVSGEWWIQKLTMSGLSVLLVPQAREVPWTELRLHPSRLGEY